MRLHQRPGPRAANTPRPAQTPPRILAVSPEERPSRPKRALDLTLGTLLLVLAAPVLAAAALALAVGAGRTPPGEGRVLKRQEVTGLHGRTFTLRSLRTRWLRLDLLSRLPEVVRGRMSLVGPAPLPARHPRARAAWRRTVRPGLTGLAQVRRISPLPWDESPLLDQHYVENHRLAWDLLLLARTLPSLLPPAGPPGARARRRSAAVVRAQRRPAQPLPSGALRATARDRARREAGASGLRGRPGSLSAHGRVTVSDTDHRSRRFIAAG